MSKYLVPFLILCLMIVSSIKKINNYKHFVDGAKKSLELVFNIFSYIAVVFIMIELFRESGLSVFLAKLLSPVMNFLGVPTELIELVILKPFSGSGTLAILNDIYLQYGVDTYIGRCASVIVGSSETVFYVSGIYFSETKVKNLGYALPLALCCTLLSAILSCLICKIIYKSLL